MQVFTFEFGGCKRVVISGYEAMHTVLVKNADYTSNHSIRSMTAETRNAFKNSPGKFNL